MKILLSEKEYKKLKDRQDIELIKKFLVEWKNKTFLPLMGYKNDPEEYNYLMLEYMYQHFLGGE